MAGGNTTSPCPHFTSPPPGPAGGELARKLIFTFLVVTGPTGASPSLLFQNQGRRTEPGLAGQETEAPEIPTDTGAARAWAPLLRFFSPDPGETLVARDLVWSQLLRPGHSRSPSSPGLSFCGVTLTRFLCLSGLPFPLLGPGFEDVLRLGGWVVPPSGLIPGLGPIHSFIHSIAHSLTWCAWP